MSQSTTLLEKLGLPQRRAPRNSGPATAIDLDGLTLLVAQSSNRATIKTVAAVPLDLPADADRNDPGVMGPAVKRALDKLGLKASSVVMGVPRSRVVLRNLKAPKMDKLAELASLVHFQIGKDLPFRPDEAVIDFKVADAITPPPKAGTEPGTEPAAPQVEILAAVVKKEVIEFYQRLAAAAGLNLAGLSLAPYGNYRCAEACEAAPADAVHALVCLRPDEVSVDVMGGQWLWFSRGASIRSTVEGAPPDPARRPGGEDFVAAAAIEVVRSLNGYAGMGPNRPVVRLSVAGATGGEDALVQSLQTRLGLPCARLNPASALGLPAELQAAANAATSAIGLALGCGDPDGLRIDFLHPKRPAVQRNMKRIRIVAACAGAVVFLAIVLGVRAKLVGARMAVLESVTTELADADKKRPAYRKVVNQAAAVEKWVGEGRNCLDQYAALSAILPPSDETYLTSITINSSGSIRLSVQARSAETLARVEKNLRGAGYEVKPLAITPAANRFGYEFRSNVEVSAPEKLKVNPRQIKPPERPADDFSLDARAWKGGSGQ